MKKVALSLAGLLAAAAFAPEASALPVFARQTGMACSACHFQHFPLLNGFGRSFKASGFTLMGAQGKVEGDGLSIPAEVNAAILTSLGYERTNATKTSPVGNANPGNLNMSPGGASTGGFYVAAENGEASLFVGGRGSDFMGYLGEITLGNGAAAMDSLKTPILVDVGGGYRAGVVFFSTNGQGASYGFETLNTGANAIHSITNTVGFQSQYINAVSAQQYIGTGNRATGAAVVVVGDMGFVNVSKFAAIGPDSGGGFAALGSTYARLALTGDISGWDAAIGVQNWQGSSVNVTPAAGAVPVFIGVVDTKARAVDGQLQGSIGGLPTGFYFSYANAPRTTTAINGNLFNPGGTFSRSAFNIDAEVGVIPEKATIGAAIRRGKAGVANANGQNASDNAIFLTATYKLAQNLLTRFSYVKQSGDLWAAATGNTALLGSQSYTVNLYALF